MSELFRKALYTELFNINLFEEEEYKNVSRYDNLDIAHLSENTKEKVKTTLFNRYPQDQCTSLRSAYATYCNLDKDEVIATSGTEQSIRVICDTFMDTSDNLIAINVGNDRLGKIIYTIKCNFSVIDALNKDGEIDEQVIVDFANRSKSKIIFLSSLCHLIGIRLNKNQIEKILELTHCMLVIDEAYIEFSGGSVVELIRKYDKLIVLRTMSNAFALPAIRLGFILANRDTIKYLTSMKPVYNICTVTQAIAEEALKNENRMMSFIEYIKSEKEFIQTELEQGSTATFCEVDADIFGLVLPEDMAHCLSNFMNKLNENNIAYLMLSEDSLLCYLGDNEYNKILTTIIKEVYHNEEK